MLLSSRDSGVFSPPHLQGFAVFMMWQGCCNTCLPCDALRGLGSDIQGDGGGGVVEGRRTFLAHGLEKIVQG